ncbi:polysaccharide lyase family 14 protein [Vararia minispora EC-137]|uniref:Polysaccharide lyase family 14 protein n=1 Tax=Vararia minispora EC-137 TaxID=1314806 RepID=A0ACB8QZ12_9AGAM|nr:polysaccharide lyase family 14 protein [Vararia minispora EC-137]
MFTTLALFVSTIAAQSVVPIVATTSTIIPYPSATLISSDAQTFIQSNWGLSKGKIQNGASNVDFVADPFPNNPAPRVSSNTSGPVLRVTYPAGSFSNNNLGGTQLYSLWNSSGNPFESMMISYEVAFGVNFDWVKGGKLPGLRGGAPNGCSGGNQADGVSCFSTRTMWRTNGAGEIYAYVPRDNNICGASGVQCNDEFGASIGRGDFTFVSGQWNKVTMVIWLNSPVDTANGRAQMYYNDILAIDQSNMVFRTSDNLTANGLYLSTFFGGGDSSWAPQTDQQTYFRNFELFGGPNPSNLTGAKIQNAAVSARSSTGSVWLYLAFAAVGALVL